MLGSPRRIVAVGKISVSLYRGESINDVIIDVIAERSRILLQGCETEKEFWDLLQGCDTEKEFWDLCIGS